MTAQDVCIVFAKYKWTGSAEAVQFPQQPDEKNECTDGNGSRMTRRWAKYSAVLPPDLKIGQDAKTYETKTQKDK